MVKRVIRCKGFNEWYTPAGEPKGSGTFRGEAGVLVTAIDMLTQWAQNQDAVPFSEIQNTTVLFTLGQSNAANCGIGRQVAETKVYNYYEGHLYKAEDPLIVAQASYIAQGKEDFFSKEVIAAQKELARKYDDILAGPNTDKLQKWSDRGPAGGCHFGPEGLDRHAELWLKVFKKMK